MANRDDRNYYEIELDNKQLIFFILIAIVICGVFFLIGVKVGKNAKELEYSSLANSDSTINKKTNIAPSEKNGEENTNQQQSKPHSFYKLSEEPSKESNFKPQSTKKEEVKNKESKEKPTPTKTPYVSTTTINQEQTLTNARYTVQVLSTSFNNEALDMRRKLKDKNYPAFVRQVKDPKGNIVYKVRVGSFTSKAKAEEMRQRLKIQEKITDAWVTQDKP